MIEMPGWSATPPPTPAASGVSRSRRWCCSRPRPAAGRRWAAPSRSWRCCAPRSATTCDHRIAFCADTCHLYSAGYDLVGDYDGVWRAWDEILGLDKLLCLHLNDSKTKFASRRDRHELIGEGSLGPQPFRRIMTDPRLAHVIKILETPKGDDGVTADRKMLRRLRRYARAAAAAALTGSPSPAILAGMRAILGVAARSWPAAQPRLQAQVDYNARARGHLGHRPRP